MSNNVIMMLEILFGVLTTVSLGLIAWLLKEVVDLKVSYASIETKLSHINKAVNNVQNKDDKTLREMVLDIHNRQMRLEESNDN